jgi:hypothetical protein
MPATTVFFSSSVSPEYPIRFASYIVPGSARTEMDFPCCSRCFWISSTANSIPLFRFYGAISWREYNDRRRSESGLERF